MSINKIDHFQPLLLSLVAALGMLVGIQFANSNEGENVLLKKVNPDTEQVIIEALGHISEKFYGSYDTVSFTESVVRSMISNLDEYSHYWDNRHSEYYQQYLNGSYFGRGFELFQLDSVYYVTSVIEGGPADAMQIARGDKILQINESVLSKMTMDSVQILLSRPEPVSIQMMRADGMQIDTLDLPYEDVRIPVVESFRIRHSNAIYIKIERFTKEIFIQFMDELDDLKKEGSDVTDLIIDVRDNPGGLIDETIKLLNQFIPEKDVPLLSTIDNQGKTKSYKSNGRLFFNPGRIVVLVNEKSASASEILAGSLQDLDRAVILGENTYGKGLIQQNYQLSNGGSLSLTVGEYLLPSGRSISQLADSSKTFKTIQAGRNITSSRGINPDISVVMNCTNPFKQDLYNEYVSFIIEKGLIGKRVLDSIGYGDLYEEFVDQKVFLNRDCEDAKYDFYTFLSHMFQNRREYYQAESFDPSVNKAIDILNDGTYERILKGATL